MDLQLIIVVETNEITKSDWIYIKDTLDHFYVDERGRVKYTPIYMEGNYKKERVKKQIQSAIKKYKNECAERQSKVIYCIDCDDYDSSPADERIMREIAQYCTDNKYELVWFCKDIERVYLGNRVEVNKKGKEAKRFKANKLIKSIDASKLSSNCFGANRSNILKIFDRYLTRKYSSDR